MSIGAEVAAGRKPEDGTRTVPSPGSQGAWDALLDLVASVLAAEYVDRMQAAAKASSGSQIDAQPSSELA